MIERSFCEAFSIAPWEINMDDPVIHDTVYRYLHLAELEAKHTPKKKGR